jgi:hypothetical protein
LCLFSDRQERGNRTERRKKREVNGPAFGASVIRSPRIILIWGRLSLFPFLQERKKEEEKEEKEGDKPEDSGGICKPASFAFDTSQSHRHLR